MPINPVQKNNITRIGDPDKPFLIFAHGFGLDQSSWRFIQDAFTDTHQLLLFDNVGASPATLESYSPIRYSALQSYADDLLDICQSLLDKPAVFVGHSAGGMMGLLAGIKAPRYFRQQILIGSSPRYINEPHTGYVGGFDQSDLEELFEQMEQNYFDWVSGFASLAMNQPHKPDLATEFSRTLANLRPDIAVDVAKAIFGSDYRSSLPQVSLPVALLFSSQDVTVPYEVGDYMQAHIAGSQLIRMKSEGHFPHIAEPAEVIRHLKSVIDSLP